MPMAQCSLEPSTLTKAHKSSQKLAVTRILNSRQLPAPASNYIGDRFVKIMCAKVAV
ncbi:uncharacterized protein PHALS_12558 [Plasmopara halstedii]|uniref:Uncharacterized protein n=1 Tax=Plasmopara halstedii TaxID=4781 RepID=A0A0P1AM47_PLAHL|nr:uncharacterized protein PHALS_12558 [Plasmopara halstedii]CEG42268.1 hypothetical protein PHALS_12558 [Plasmopara halstedii]|eukprot:XP_024578637.1 hypothetical protein PHALS_12558 [Plasmopara halstedii]